MKFGSNFEQTTFFLYFAIDNTGFFQQNLIEFDTVLFSLIMIIVWFCWCYEVGLVVV